MCEDGDMLIVAHDYLIFARTKKESKSESGNDMTAVPVFQAVFSDFFDPKR